MKHKLQTLLKHKLQWFLLLAAILGVSHGVWADKGFFGDGMWAIKFYKNSDSGDTYISGQKNGSTYDIGTVTNLYLKGGWVKTWSNSGWTQRKVRMRCELTSSEYDIYKSAVQGDQTWEQTTWNLNLISSASNNPGTNTVTMTYTLDDYVSANGYFKFTIPGWTTTSSSKSFGSVNVGSNSSETVSLGTHYGASPTVTSSVSGTNSGDFKVTSVSATSVTVKFTPSAAGNRTATITITDSYSKTYTLTVSGTGTSSCTKPDAVAISGTSTLTFANNSETVQTTLTATGTGDTNHDIYTYGWTNQTVMTGTAPSYSSTSAYNPTITFSREGTYTVRASANCTGGTATTQDKTVTIKPGRLYISGPLYNGTWAITDYMTRSVSSSTITYTKEWSANLSASKETNHFTVSRITTQNNASTIVNAYAYLATKTGISENGGTNNNLYPSFDVTEGDGLRLTVVYKGEVNGSGSSRKPTYYYTLEKTCSAVSKSQYTMASQTKQWTGSPITPDITKDNNAGTIKNYYYSTDGSTWTSGCPTARGTYYIKIDVNAGSTYCAKDGIILDNTLKITRKSRTISIDNTDVVCGAGSYTITSTASVGSGTKTYSIKSDPSSIASIGESTGELTLTGAGTFTVQVNIAASGNYAAASGTKEFTVTLPTISTSAATGISYASATLNGSVSDVTCTPPSSGFEYKKGSDAYTSVAAASATGSISKEISGLTPGTTYTFRTYTVVNGVTKYSSTRTFTTTSCSAPVISSSSLSAQSKCKDEVGTAMTVTASGGVGTLTYTWYKKNDTTPSGGTQVQSSTSNNYTPPTGTVGTLYYYCVVSSASPCASSTVNSGISGAVEIMAKPTLTISPAGTIYNYMPLTVSSDMDVATWSWSATGNSVSGYFTSELTRSATFKGKVVDGSATRTATFTATGTNGCNGTIEQDITKDTESCN